MILYSIPRGFSPALPVFPPPQKPLFNSSFATNGQMVQTPPYWRASSLLFPHWDIKTETSEA